MKTALILAVLFSAALAAPAEDKVFDELKAVEAAAEAPEEELVAVADVAVKAPEEKMAAAEAPVFEEAYPADARFNFCPNGWQFRGSQCFLYVSSSMTWYNAKEHCNSLGANLASATNPNEYTFMQELAQSGRQSTAWMGGFYLQGSWLWVDRQGMYYTNWYSINTPSSYPCMHLRTSGGWSNSNCGSNLPFICSQGPSRC